VTTLPTLADRINAAHAQCESATRSALEHAAEAGRLLTEAKAQAGHGNWLPWLKANVTCSERTAQVYMRIAARYEELTAGNPQTSAGLSIDGAIKLLAKPATITTATMADASLDESWPGAAGDDEFIPAPGTWVIVTRDRADDCVWVIPYVVGDDK